MKLRVLTPCLLSIALVLLPPLATGQQDYWPEAEVLENRITASKRLTSDRVWRLRGPTFVVTEEGAATTVLTIEPGTVLVAEAGTGIDASSLVVTRGARIEARGTRTEPILLTSVYDGLNGNLSEAETGLWGGLFLLGRAPLNSVSTGSPVPPLRDRVDALEVPEAEDNLLVFGGTTSNDSSGTLSYVSIRHGGARGAGSRPLHGLTLAGVGAATQIEFVEVFANRFDAFAVRGGNVNLRHLAASFPYDDALDIDQGWIGRVQFFFSVQKDNSGIDPVLLPDAACEFDGQIQDAGTGIIGGTNVVNATFIGSGSSEAQTAVILRDNVFAKFWNSVFVDFAHLAEIEADNFDRLQAGDNDFLSATVFSHQAANNNADGAVSPGTAPENRSLLRAIFLNERKVRFERPGLRGISRSRNGGLDPRLRYSGLAFLERVDALPDDGFYVQTPYRGAFDSENNWLKGWTALDQLGYLAEGGESRLPVNELIAVSNRGYARSVGGEEFNMGFVIRGDEPLTVVIRVSGEGGLRPVFDQELGGDSSELIRMVQDPRLTLFRRGTAIASQDHWSELTHEQRAMVAGTEFDPVNGSLVLGEKDCLLPITLEPGTYTVQVFGHDEEDDGVVLGEIFSTQQD